MTSDIRRYVKYDPPLPQWLKWLYFATVIAILGCIAVFGVTWKKSRTQLAEIESKALAMNQAQERINQAERRFNGLEASRTVKLSRKAWREETIPVAGIVFAVQLAVLDAEAEAAASISDPARTAKIPTRSRPGVDASKTNHVPDLLIKAIEVDVRLELKSPEVRIQISHNTDSRRLYTLLRKALSSYKPDGFELLNFKPEERQGQITLTTTWTRS